LASPDDGTLYVTGFTAPKFSDDEALPAGIETVFTTPMLAIVAPDSNDPVDANQITGCDLTLPLSILWAEEVYEGADLTGNGFVNFQDVAILAMYWRQTSCADPDFCAGADLEPVALPDGDVDMADVSILAGNWLAGKCRD
jgi:hypothetical protein